MLLTCAQIGKHVRTTPREVAAWIQQGKLKAARGASMTTYRVSSEEFKAFCHKQGFRPYGETVDLAAKVEELEAELSDKECDLEEAVEAKEKAERRLQNVNVLATLLDRTTGIGAILHKILHDGATDVSLLLEIHGKEISEMY